MKNPCLYTMTGAFLVGIIVSLLAPERSAQEGFTEVERRALLGEPRVPPPSDGRPTTSPIPMTP